MEPTGTSPFAQILHLVNRNQFAVAVRSYGDDRDVKGFPKWITCGDSPLQRCWKRRSGMGGPRLEKSIQYSFDQALAAHEQFIEELPQ